MLTQERKGIKHTVSYASRQLNKHEVNWSISEKEMLAIVWPSKHFKCYIFGRHVKFYTDHKPLQDLQKSKDPEGRLYQLFRKIESISYETIYIPGLSNKIADLLSRPNGAPKTNSEIMPAEANVVSINTIDIHISTDWAEELDADKEIAVVKLNARTNDDSSEYKGLENYDLWKNNRPCLLVKDRVLYLKNKNGEVPKKMRTKVCTLYHDSITAGHLGFEKTYTSICSKFYWRRMKSDILIIAQVAQFAKSRK